MKKNILCLVLSFKISMVFCQNWQQEEFMIGTFVDPRLSKSTDLSNATQVAKDIASYKLAKDAYFNLLTGFQDGDRIVNTTAGMTYALTIANAVGLKYLIRDNRINSFVDIAQIPSIVTAVTTDYKTLPSNLRTTMIGYAVKDEPLLSDVPKMTKYLERFKINDPTKLAYINLLPVYGFGSYSEYENYLDVFVNQSSVISFDHYLNKDYYYNLKIVRKKAGTKPFWVYPDPTFIKSMSMPSPTAASLQLQSFAPLAYGAKGLIYFTYEKPNTSRWLIDYGMNGWDLISDDYRSDDNEVAAVEDYDGDGRSDIAVKSDNGFWKIDYAADGFNGWNVIYNGYGGADAHPAPADYDGDGKADLSVKTNDERWLINYSTNGFATGWDHIVTGTGGADSHPAPADYDGDGKTDLSVKTDDGKWKINYSNNTFMGGWDITFDGYGGADSHPVPADYDGDGKADLSVKTDDGRWLINYANNGFAGGWEKIVTSIGGTEAHAAPGDYDGDGRYDISVKTDDGKWKIDYATNGFTGWNATVNGYGDSDYLPAAGDYNGDNITELSVRGSSNVFGNALINNNGNPGGLYATAKAINLYVSSVIGPVIMSCEHLGAFHKTLPLQDNLNADDLLPSQSMIKDVSSNDMLTGIFKEKNVVQNMNTYYLLVVNKSANVIPVCTLTMNGNYANQVFSTESFSKNNVTNSFTPLSTVYTSSDNTTKFSIPDGLLAGEGRLIKIRRIRKEIKYDFDGDGSSDLNQKKDDGKWLLDYAVNGLCNWDAMFIGNGGADAQPVPADYDNDGKTDLSVKVDDGRWLINYANNGFTGGWDATFIGSGGADAYPVPADYDGDGKLDLSVKTDDGRWLINYASNGFTGGWDITYYGYGTAAAHPVPADYDFDGKADLSVKTDDGRWLINYASNGYAGGWDVTFDKYGGADAHPIPADYDGDGKDDLSVKTDDGRWLINYAGNGFAGGWDKIVTGIGNAYANPLPGDYDGDGRYDVAIRSDDFWWRIDYAKNGFGSWDLQCNISARLQKTEENEISQDTFMNELFVYSIYTIEGKEVAKVNKVTTINEIQKNYNLRSGIYFLRTLENGKMNARKICIVAD
jgi:hypothetical protein